MNDRPTTLSTEATVTRPGCPPWCDHSDACDLGAYATPYRHVLGSAGLPAERVGALVVPQVAVALLQDDSDPGPFIALNVDAGVSVGPAEVAQLRSHEARRLAAVLVQLADLADGSAKR